jgi:hypothetical protein
MTYESRIDPEIEEAFKNAEIGRNPEQASDVFKESLPELEKGYLAALTQDTLKDNQPGVRFVWGELNTGRVTGEDMFNNAMNYLIIAETTSDESEKESYNNTLNIKFGLFGSKSYIALQKMRTSVMDAVAGGSGKEQLKDKLYEYRSENKDDKST